MEIVLVQFVLYHLRPLCLRVASGLDLLPLPTDPPSSSELGTQALKSSLAVEVGTSRLGGAGLGLGPGRSAVRAPRPHLGAREGKVTVTTEVACVCFECSDRGYELLGQAAMKIEVLELVIVIASLGNRKCFVR